MLTSKARSAPLSPIVATLAVLALVPWFSQGQIFSAVTLGLIYGIAAVGLDIFSGYGGQLSFGNFGFVAIGAYTSAILSTDHGWNVWLTLPAAMAVAGVVGAVLSLPTVKVAALGTALVTFFFAYLVAQLLGGKTFVGITHSADGIGVTQATVAGHNLLEAEPLYYTCLVSLAVVCLISWRYTNSRAGIALRVVKRSKIVAASNGIAVDRARRLAMTYSAAVAGLAGFLLAQASGYLAPENFGALTSVNLLAMVVLGGLGSVVGPVFGSIFYAVVNQSTFGSSVWTGAAFPAALLVALIVLPNGIYGLAERLAAKVWPRKRLRFGREAQLDGPSPLGFAAINGDSITPQAEEMLRLHSISVDFGGVAALSDVSMSVRTGDIHGVMGPNGAGKTTLLNCVSGVQPHRGNAILLGSDLSGCDSRTVSGLGVSRTFQSPSLVPDLDVMENVLIGAQRSASRWTPRNLAYGARRRRDAHARHAARAALELLEFPQQHQHLAAIDLTLAEQKIVDVARAVAGRPSLVLLDEPTAGLDEQEVDQMALALETVRAAGVTILVIAHHVDFLRRVADQVTVLNFGHVIATGTPDEVLARQEVIDIYLGSAHV